MKKIVLFLLLLNLSLVIPAYSFDFENAKSNIELRSVVRKYNKALIRHDSNKVKSFYDVNYKSSDGFDLDKLTEMLDKTFTAYKNIKYKTKIKDINVDGDKAEILIQDLAYATVYPTLKKDLKKEKMGKLCGTSTYTVRLKKQNKSWKIVSDSVLEEETSLKYGLAREIQMDLITPEIVKAGEQYDLSLKMDMPEDVIALASISREEVVYPPVDYKEKFRKFPESGELERVVRANNNNHDEYGVASVGFTKVSINDSGNRAKIEVLGMAYIMKRIDMAKISEKVKEVKVDNEG